jgi:hypothetical protein
VPRRPRQALTNMESQSEVTGDGPSKMTKRPGFWGLISLVAGIAFIVAAIPSYNSWSSTAIARLHTLPSAQQKQYLQSPTKLMQIVSPPVGIGLAFVGFGFLLVAIIFLIMTLRVRPWFGYTAEEAAARIRLRRAEQQLAQQLGAAAQVKAGVYRVPPLDTAAPSSAEAPDGTEELGTAEQPEAEQLGSAEREGPQRRRLRTVVEPLTDTEGRLAQVARDSLTLPALWEVTHSRLDLYHQIATDQARRSFVTAQLAIGAGFVLLVAFAILATRTQTTAGAITTAALGAVSAALAGYISRTFVRSQESAAAHLRVYFDQPLEFSKYLAAERLLSSTAELEGDKRAAILTALVQAIVTPSPSLDGKSPKLRDI